KRINSSALMADAWHHRSDAISSIGALIGIAGAKLGFPILDPIASLVICLFIFKAAIDVFKEAVGKMIDKACDAQTEEAIREAVLSVPEVMAIDNLKTRLFGPRMYVDVEIAVDGNKPLIEAHRIAEKVHDRIEARFPEVKHCMVHENPASETLMRKS
ncbi:MAG: cation diffusion facilitator family transporter, partial [Clostridia bacterium]|nr:cation diffusion facilitator family transporter [Clostridia bacterium]